MKDSFGLTLTTSSAEAADAYCQAVDKFLAYDGGVIEAFQKAIDLDQNLALAHVALARYHQVRGNRDAIAAPLARAQALADHVSDRERSHINIFSLMLSGKGADALTALRAHVSQWPRDAMIAQSSCGVFGLIGFSGAPGREAEQLAFTTSLLPYCSEDWWFLAQHGFAQLEVGQLLEAEASLDKARAGNPRSANTAHILAHLYYEEADADTGRAYLNEWMRDYPEDGLMYCHIAWHQALWALEEGDLDTMWAQIDRNIASGTKGPPLNVLTDTAAILFRAELAGVSVPVERWRAISAYALHHFPKPMIGFADVHAALAHAMAGDTDALHRIAEGAVGPARDLVTQLALSFGDTAQQNWAGAEAKLVGVMNDHARIGGSKAQRDLVEFALAAAMIRQGRARDARALLRMHRPRTTPPNAIAGLQGA
jgi:tetratricopeptide (TPR) repeat protein